MVHNNHINSQILKLATAIQINFMHPFKSYSLRSAEKIRSCHVKEFQSWIQCLATRKGSFVETSSKEDSGKMRSHMFRSWKLSTCLISRWWHSSCHHWEPASQHWEPASQHSQCHKNLQSYKWLMTESEDNQISLNGFDNLFQCSL